MGQGSGYRILLFDEERTAAPVIVLTSGPIPVPPGPDVRSESFSASADGRVVVLMRRLSERQTTYYLVRPETGEIRTLLSEADLAPPVVSADGSRIAYARTSQDPALHGLWLFSTAAGASPPTRLVSDHPERVGSPPQPVGWSPDGKWLAIALGLGDSGTAITVIHPAGGEARYNAAANPPTLVGGRGRIFRPQDATTVRQPTTAATSGPTHRIRALASAWAASSTTITWRAHRLSGRDKFVTLDDGQLRRAELPSIRVEMIRRLSFRWLA